MDEYKCICTVCDHKCIEYFGNGVSNYSYNEWVLKKEECEKEKQNGKGNH